MLTRIRIILTSLSVALAGAVFVLSASPAQAMPPMKVMTWNVLGWCKDAPKPGDPVNKLSLTNGLIDAIVGFIEKNDIDAAMLQEIGQNQYEEVLTRLINDAKDKKADYTWYGYYANKDSIYPDFENPQKKKLDCTNGNSVAYEPSQDAIITKKPIDYTSEFTKSTKLMPPLGHGTKIYDQTINCVKVADLWLRLCSAHLVDDNDGNLKDFIDFNDPWKIPEKFLEFLEAQNNPNSDNNKQLHALAPFLADPRIATVLAGDLNNRWAKPQDKQKEQEGWPLIQNVATFLQPASLLEVGALWQPDHIVVGNHNLDVVPDAIVVHVKKSDEFPYKCYAPDTGTEKYCSDHNIVWGTVPVTNVQQDTGTTLDVDGYLGPLTVQAWDKVLGAYFKTGMTVRSSISGQLASDAKFVQPSAPFEVGSGGSSVVKAAQQVLRTAIEDPPPLGPKGDRPSQTTLKFDGLLTTKTIKDLQTCMGLSGADVDVDGYMAATPSMTVALLQQRLSHGLFCNPKNKTQLKLDQPDLGGGPAGAGAMIGLALGSLSVPVSGGSASTTVTTNQASWKASTAARWLTVTPSGVSGQVLSVSAKENQTGAPRVASVSVTAGNALATVQVSQDPAPRALTQPTDSWGGAAASVSTSARAVDNPYQSTQLAQSSMLTGSGATVPTVDPSVLYAADGNGNFAFGPNVAILDPGSLTPTQQFAFGTTPTQEVAPVAVDGGGQFRSSGFYFWSNPAARSGAFGAANETPVWFAGDGDSTASSMWLVPNASAFGVNAATTVGCLPRSGGGVVDQPTGVLFMLASWCPQFGSRGDARIIAFDPVDSTTYWSGQLQPVSGRGGADDLWTSPTSASMGWMASGLVAAADGDLLALVYGTDKMVPASAAYNPTGRAVAAGSMDPVFLVKVHPWLGPGDWTYEVVNMWLPDGPNTAYSGGMAMTRGSPMGFGLTGGVFYAATNTRIYRLDPASSYYSFQGLAGRNVKVDPANPAPQGLGTIAYGSYTSFSSAEAYPVVK